MTPQALRDLATWLDAQADSNLQPLIANHDGRHQIDGEARAYIARTAQQLKFKADDLRYQAQLAERPVLVSHITRQPTGAAAN